MHRRALIYIALVVVLIATSCSQKIVFTAKLRDKLEKQDVNLKDIQFYNSDKITLEREEERPEEYSVRSGTVKVEEGRTIEEVIIKKKTPGVCVEAHPYHLNISFEPGSDKVLKFGRKAGNHLTNSFKLYAKEWKGEQGKIQYGDTIYQTDKKAASSHLLVKKSQIYELIREKRVAEGRKISE